MENNPTNDNNIIDIAKFQGKLEAIKVCKMIYGMNRKMAKKHVNEITIDLNLPNQIISKKWIILISFFIVFIGLEIWLNLGNIIPFRTSDKWQLKHYVDNFGDKTGDPYLNYEDFNGTFSNSVTNNSDLKASVTISYSKKDSLPSIIFDLREYGLGKAVGKPLGGNTENLAMGLTIKLSDNSTEDYDLLAVDEGLFIYNEKVGEVNSLLNHLKSEKKPIKCNLRFREGDIQSTYNFKINTDGFNEAFSKIKTK